MLPVSHRSFTADKVVAFAALWWLAAWRALVITPRQAPARPSPSVDHPVSARDMVMIASVWTCSPGD